MPASLYKPAIVNTILKHLSEGKNLEQIAELPGMPKAHTIQRWTVRHPTFKQRYKQARKGHSIGDGRPSIPYNEEIATEMLFRISQGESIMQVCKTPGFPSYPVFSRWLTGEGMTEFHERYLRARREQADCHIEETLIIADEATEIIKGLEDPRHSSAIAKITTDRIRARQWKAARMHPQHWSDKQTLDVSGMVKMVKMEDIKRPKKAGTGKMKKAKKK